MNRPHHHVWRGARRKVAVRLLGLSAVLTAATALAQPVVRDAVEAADGSAVPAPASSPAGGFFGEPDSPRRQALLEGAIARVTKGRGGRSLSFRITLQNGTEGYFKPEQSFSAAHWWGELGAYYLDRALGLGRVPPAIGREVAWSALATAADDDRRVGELRIRGDRVRGAFVWWVPEGLDRWRLPRGWERVIRMRHGLDITPYQRPSDLRAMRAGESRYYEATDPRRADLDRAPLTDEQSASLSDLVLFDYLTHNADRWGGNFTNVRRRGPDGPLTFMDNGAAFPLREQHSQLLRSRLRAVQRFRRSTIDSIRRLDLDALRAEMDQDPLAPILNERQFEGLAERRERLLKHVASQHRRHGDAVFAW